MFVPGLPRTRTSTSVRSMPRRTAEEIASQPEVYISPCSANLNHTHHRTDMSEDLLSASNVPSATHASQEMRQAPDQYFLTFLTVLASALQTLCPVANENVEKKNIENAIPLAQRK